MSERKQELNTPVLRIRMILFEHLSRKRLAVLNLLQRKDI